MGFNSGFKGLSNGYINVQFPPHRESNRSEIQVEHKVFPWLQTFITRRLRGIQTFFYHYLN